MTAAIKRFYTQNKLYCLVIAALVVFFLSLGTIRAASDPFLYTKDEALHLDYAYQVSKLQLPTFFGGPVTHPEKDLELRYKEMPDVQWTYQHPPLYYTLLAPVVGPLIDADHTRWAVLAGRVITVLLGSFFILASAWLGYAVANRNKFVVSALTACISTGSLFVLLVSAAIYNDILFLTLSTAAIALAITIYKQRKLDKRYILLLAFICSLGMLSRLTFAFTLLFVLLFVLLTIIRERPSTKKLGKAIVPLVVTGGIPFLASSWFYVRNYLISGSFSGAQPEWAAENLGRPVYGFFGSLADGRFWSSLNNLYTSFTSFLTPILLVIGLGIFFVALRRIIRRKFTTTDVVTVVLSGYTLSILIMFCGYISVGGAANARYLLPIVPVVSLVLAILVARLSSAALTTSVAAVALFTVALDALLHQARTTPQDLLSEGPIAFMSNAFGFNHVPGKAFGLLLVSLVVGYCVLLVSIYRLRKKARS